MEGWVKIHRNIVERERYNDINATRLFLHLIFICNHKDAKWRGIDIKRGQKITSINILSEEIGLSVMQTRTAIKKLKSTGEVTSKSTSKYTLLTLENYDKRQIDNKQDNKPVTSEQQTDNKPVTTNKKDNNKKNEEKKKIELEKRKAIAKCFENYVEAWNKIELVSKHKIKDFKQLPKVEVVTIDLKKAFKTKYDSVGKDGIVLGTEKYWKEIQDRTKDDTGYYNHRRDMYTFLKNSRALLTYINK